MWDLDMLCNYVSNICPSSDETHIHIYKLHRELQLVNCNNGRGGSPRILNSATLSAWMTHHAIVHRILHLYHTHIVPSHSRGHQLSKQIHNTINSLGDIPLCKFWRSGACGDDEGEYSGRSESTTEKVWAVSYDSGKSPEIYTAGYIFAALRIFTRPIPLGIGLCVRVCVCLSVITSKMIIISTRRLHGPL